MSARDYWDFIHEVQDVFGFDSSDARQYYREFKEVFTGDQPATVDDLRDFADEAADLADAYLADEYEDIPEFPEFPQRERLRRDDDDEDDSDFVDDDDPWLDAGEELEVTADLTYEDR